ncbi:unnamed protein product [Ectocarpus sp. 12 AP-2014]
MVDKVQLKKMMGWGLFIEERVDGCLGPCSAVSSWPTTLAPNLC